MLFQQLLIDLFKFLAPFLRNAELNKPTHLLYKVSAIEVVKCCLIMTSNAETLSATDAFSGISKIMRDRRRGKGNSSIVPQSLYAVPH